MGNISEDFLIDAHSCSPLQGGMVPPALVDYIWSPTKISRSQGHMLRGPQLLLGHRVVSDGVQKMVLTAVLGTSFSGHNQMMAPPSHSTRKACKSLFSVGESHIL